MLRHSKPEIEFAVNHAGYRIFS